MNVGRFSRRCSGVIVLMALLCACGAPGESTAGQASPSAAIRAASSPVSGAATPVEPTPAAPPQQPTEALKPTPPGPAIEGDTPIPTVLTRVPVVPSSSPAPAATPGATLQVPTGGLAFRSLGQSAPPNTEPRMPAVYVAASANDLAAFAALLTEEHQQAAGAVDYSTYLVLAVFSGAVGSSGSTMTVEQVTVDGGTLRVVAARQDPAPDQNALAVFTSPYHLVLLPRAELGGIPTSWTLVDSLGQVMATGDRR